MNGAPSLVILSAAKNLDPAVVNYYSRAEVFRCASGWQPCDYRRIASALSS